MIGVFQLPAEHEFHQGRCLLPAGAPHIPGEKLRVELVEQAHILLLVQQNVLRLEQGTLHAFRQIGAAGVNPEQSPDQNGQPLFGVSRAVPETLSQGPALIIAEDGIKVLSRAEQIHKIRPFLPAGEGGIKLAEKGSGLFPMGHPVGEQKLLFPRAADHLGRQIQGIGERAQCLIQSGLGVCLSFLCHCAASSFRSLPQPLSPPSGSWAFYSLRTTT